MWSCGGPSSLSHAPLSFFFLVLPLSSRVSPLSPYFWCQVVFWRKMEAIKSRGQKKASEWGEEESYASKRTSLVYVIQPLDIWHVKQMLVWLLRVSWWKMCKNFIATLSKVIKSSCSTNGSFDKKRGSYLHTYIQLDTASKQGKKTTTSLLTFAAVIVGGNVFTSGFTFSLYSTSLLS